MAARSKRCRPRSLSARRAWIEMRYNPAAISPSPSLSARRAWIEISRARRACGSKCVALRKESVDRNQVCAHSVRVRPVALRKESVDRNILNVICHRQAQVALRKESVDRNHAQLIRAGNRLVSLSARRAWIEIRTPSC